MPLVTSPSFCTSFIERVYIDVFDAFCVKHTGTADDPMNFVSFGKQRFCKVRAVLPGNPGDECAFYVRSFSSLQCKELEGQSLNELNPVSPTKQCFQKS